MTTLLRTLRVARALLDSPGRWQRKGWAADARGQPCNIDAFEARSFCLTAAVRRGVVSLMPEAQPDACGKLYDSALSALMPALHVRLPQHVRRKREPASVQLMRFNDSPFTQHSDVIAVLDQTIARLDHEIIDPCADIP